MSQVDELKLAIDNISKKKHVISSEATYAKEILNNNKSIQDFDIKNSIEKQNKLLKEFNVSINLLMNIFKQSRFDQVMGFVAHPSRLIVINFVLAIVRGIGFAIGFLLISIFIFKYLKDYLVFL